MSLLEGLLPVSLGNVTIWTFSGSILNNGSNSRCHQLHDELDGCYNDSYAFTLKLIAIASILVAGVSGVATPLIGRKHHFLRNDSNLFVAAKAFAAGVILATGFVHMLPDATSSLTNACLPEIPWRKFPFSGFVAMMAALATLLADLVGTQYYERKQEKQQQLVARVDLECSHSGSGIVRAQTNQFDGKLLFEEEEAVIPLLGTHTHSGHQNHSQEHVAYQGCSPENSHDHSHSHGIDIDDEELVARHAVISQVLEFGIVSHSVIIRLSLGVSRSPCTIGPLLGALSFHQLFEGFALGGCIAQAQFQPLQSTMMACFFALTTPLGIAVGIGISSVYDGSSPGALIIQGLLDSVSAGILVYMALVDLIAANFLNKRMTGDPRLTAVSFLALFFGAVLMSSLAAWA